MNATMGSNEVAVEKNEVAIKYVDDGFEATDLIQTLYKKKLQNGLLLKVDIILVGMISLIMLVNQWVSSTHLTILRRATLIIRLSRIEETLETLALWAYNLISIYRTANFITFCLCTVSLSCKCC